MVLGTFFFPYWVYLGDQVKNPGNHFFQHEPFARKKTGFRIQGFPVTICRKQFNIIQPPCPERISSYWGKFFGAFFVVKGTQCSPVFRLPASPSTQVPCEACSETCWKLSKWRHGDIATAGFCGWMSHQRRFLKAPFPKRLQGWSMKISLLWFSWCFVGKNRRQSTQVASQFTVTSASGFKSFVEFCSSLECKKKVNTTFLLFGIISTKQKVILVWSVQPKKACYTFISEDEGTNGPISLTCVTGDSSRDLTWSPIWRSLDPLKGHVFTIPKGSHFRRFSGIAVTCSKKW